MNLQAVLVALSALGITAALPVSQVLEPRSCAATELIWASGTFESGLGSVGQPLASALGDAVPGLSVYNIPYNTAAEYIFTVNAGAVLMRDRINQTLSDCPGTIFALGGYSKGAMVVHHATKGIPAAQIAAVRAIAVFGDPNTSPKGIAAFEDLSNTWPIDNVVVGVNVYEACVPTDDFCDGGGLNGLADHLSYGTNGDVPTAVALLGPLLLQ